MTSGTTGYFYNMITCGKVLSYQFAHVIDSDRPPGPIANLVHKTLGPAIKRMFSADVAAGRESNPGVVRFCTVVPFTNTTTPAELIVARCINRDVVGQCAWIALRSISMTMLILMTAYLPMHRSHLTWVMKLK